MLDLWPEDLAKRLQDLPLADAVVAFDADETLWHVDAGIGFLEDSSRRRVLAGEGGGAGAYEAYLATREADEGAGLMACATAFVGLTEARVQELAADYAARDVVPRIYPEMRQLFAWLHGQGARVFVVTASFEHAVRAAAGALGVPPERVVGIRMAVEDGIVTDQRVGPITYRGGKPAALRAVSGAAPVLAMGNGSNDRELLEAATQLAVAINPSSKPRRDGTPSLQDAAERYGWPTLRLADPQG